MQRRLHSQSLGARSLHPAQLHQGCRMLPSSCGPEVHQLALRILVQAPLCLLNQSRRAAAGMLMWISSGNLCPVYSRHPLYSRSSSVLSPSASCETVPLACGSRSVSSRRLVHSQARLSSSAQHSSRLWVSSSGV